MKKLLTVSLIQLKIFFRIWWVWPIIFSDAQVVGQDRRHVSQPKPRGLWQQGWHKAQVARRDRRHVSQPSLRTKSAGMLHSPVAGWGSRHVTKPRCWLGQQACYEVQSGHRCPQHNNIYLNPPETRMPIITTIYIAIITRPIIARTYWMKKARVCLSMAVSMSRPELDVW